MAQVQISDGTRVVTIEEVPEQRPVPPMGMEVLPDITGGAVVYQRAGKLREVPLSGRVKSKAEAAYLESFLDEGCALELTERDGTVTSDWRIKSEPLPILKRKDGDSQDWIITLTLWRMP